MADSTAFQEELFQDVLNTANAQGVYYEDAFFDIVTDYLIEAGEFEEAVRSFYGPRNSGIRVDGYCGDPLDSGLAREIKQGTLGLIILDFNQDAETVTLGSAEMEADFRRLWKFITQSTQDKFRNSLEPTDPGFGLADLINSRWPIITRINLYLLTNKKLSSRVASGFHRKQRSHL